MSSKRRVLYAHPDRWTINAEYPPEERARMREALAGFAVEWLRWKGTVKLTVPESAVEDTGEQREAAAAVRAARKKFGARARRVGRFPLEPVVAALIDGVVTGALWGAPAFHAKDGGALTVFRGWRLIVDLGPRDERALALVAKRHALIVRAR